MNNPTIINCKIYKVYLQINCQLKKTDFLT